MMKFETFDPGGKDSAVEVENTIYLLTFWKLKRFKSGCSNWKISVNVGQLILNMSTDGDVSFNNIVHWTI